MPTYTEIQALQASADAARRAKDEEIAALILLAAATRELLENIRGVLLGSRGTAGHVAPVVVQHREQLEPLVNSLGFSLQPSPTYVGQFVLVPWSKE